MSLLATVWRGASAKAKSGLLEKEAIAQLLLYVVWLVPAGGAPGCALNVLLCVGGAGIAVGKTRE